MKSLWVPLSGAISQQRNVEVIANNVANANTPGFKRDQIVFKEHLTSLEAPPEVIDLPRKEWAPEDFYRTQGAEHGFVKIHGTFSDLKQGALAPTQNPLDLGLKGNGFFEVLGPNGLRYTRKGNFSLNSDGELVTNEGFRVLGKLSADQILAAGLVQDESEEPSSLPQPKDRVIKFTNPKTININLQGQVFENGNLINELSITDFVDPHALKKEGNSFFINTRNENLNRKTSTLVHQGFLEESNVNSVAEMSELIKAHRNFDSIQKVIKAYDNISGKTVNDLTKF